MTTLDSKSTTPTSFPRCCSSLSKSTYIFILMASLLFLSLTLFLSLYLSSAAYHHHHHHPSPNPSLQTARSEIVEACKAIRFPEQCGSSLTDSNHLPPNPTPLQIIHSAIWVSSENLETAQSMVKNILDSSTDSPNRTTAAKNCLEVLRYSGYRTSLTTDALLRGRTKDARAWMSASLLYQYGCWSGLKYVNDTQTVDKTITFLNFLVGLSSNALSMIAAYDNFGNDTRSWRPRETERDGFWEDSVSGGSGSGSGFSGGFPTKLSADVTVCKNGSEGCYTTVQEAVDAAPENATARFVIHIKEGVYEEIVRIPLEKKNVVFLGDGMGKTVITGSMNVGQPGISTYNSATVGVLGDGFMASGLTIQNTAGSDAHQAVAFRSDSDLSIVQNVEFIGNQDTLYAHSLRQFYKSCKISGNVDFIFGNSASVFQDCEILIRPRRLDAKTREENAIAAHGRADPAQSTGFVFQNCLINGTEEFMSLYYRNPQMYQSFLGRPWKEYSRTVFIHCNLEALISPAGWMPWSGEFGLKTLYYGEFENSGRGSTSSERVDWSSRIPAEHVFSYSVESFIQGNEWIPLA